MLSKLPSQNFKLCSKQYNEIILLHLIVAPQLGGSSRHNYSTKTRQEGHANDQAMYSLMSISSLALFISIVPSYISRSVAGSYDNEAVAITALVNTFYLWIKAVNTGSIMWAVICSLQYFYMVSAWGGYSFIINLIPVFVLGTMFINKFNKE